VPRTHELAARVVDDPEPARVATAEAADRPGQIGFQPVGFAPVRVRPLARADPQDAVQTVDQERIVERSQTIARLPLRHVPHSVRRRQPAE